MQREGEQVAIAELLADLGRLSGDCRRSGEVSRALPLERRGQQHVAALYRVAFLALEEALRAPEPATGRPHLAAQREVHPDPERAAHGAQRLPGLEVRVVRALEDAQNSPSRPSMNADSARSTRSPAPSGVSSSASESDSKASLHAFLA